MVKNYPFLILVIWLGCWPSLFSQEIKMFTSNDFDLRGKVKSCSISTNYGKEEYDFNRDGLLTKSVTRYSDSDYDITYYRYKASDLLEKRLEIYRDNRFDKATSIANFYTIDTAGTKKITEKIISYDKIFLDQYQYFYGADNKLTKIIRTNNEGTDETVLDYSVQKDEATKTVLLNGAVQETVRITLRKSENGDQERIELTKYYLEGDPNSALEEIFDAREFKISRTEFIYDTHKKEFIPTTTTTYSYDEKGMLAQKSIKRGASTETKLYLYQYDAENVNWIKQIITPDNSYKTRKITYYEAELIPEVD